MTDWVFYSAAARLASAGDLLRAIPTRRNLRLERTIVDEGGESGVESVRAAESLFGLDAVLRLASDPSDCVRLVIRESDAGAREAYAALASTIGPSANDVRVVAQLTLPPGAVRDGHAALADEAVAGLEVVFPGGVARDERSAEIVAAAALVRASDPDACPYSHVDVEYVVSGAHYEFVSHLLLALPPALRALVRTTERGIAVSGRAPMSLSADELVSVRSRLLDCAPYASDGRIRFRREGAWEDAVEGIGRQVAPLPEEWTARRSGVRSVLNKLFGR